MNSDDKFQTAPDCVSLFSPTLYPPYYRLKHRLKGVFIYYDRGSVLGVHLILVFPKESGVFDIEGKRDIVIFRYILQENLATACLRVAPECIILTPK